VEALALALALALGVRRRSERGFLCGEKKRAQAALGDEQANNKGGGSRR
jgi:hypothetical protein